MELVLQDDTELSEMRRQLAELLDEERSIQAQIDALQKKKQKTMLRKQLVESEIHGRIQDEVKRLSNADAGQTSDASDQQSSEDERPLNVNENARFLEEGDVRGNDRVALASYPRSGNSLLRSMIEELTGITTGSDSDPKRELIKHLIEMGMKGEGVVDHRVWCVKTHYPERLGYCKMTAKRVVVVIRNPFDSIVSYFNMVLTQTHTHSLQDSEFAKYASIWDTFLREELVVWKRFHAHWKHESSPKPFIIRYEDLVQHRRESLTKLAEFFYGNSSTVHLSQTEINERVQQLAGRPLEHIGVYQPRSAFQQESCDAEMSSSVVKGTESGQEDGAGTRSIKQQGADEGDENKTRKGSGLPIPAWRPLELNKNGYLNGIRYFSEEQKKFVLFAAKEELSEFGYWDPFVEEYGPPHIPPPPGKCIVAETKDNKKFGYRLNTRYPIRPSTDDDPFARGFGRRWKLEVSKLPPPRVVLKTSQKEQRHTTK